MARTVTLDVPLWLLVVLPLLLLLGLAFLWQQTAAATGLQRQIGELELQAKKMSLELQAQKSQKDAYTVEAVQLQQNLKVLEGEINRLRKKAGLPAAKLVTDPVSTPPTPEDKNKPKGAGVALDLGDLLLSLRSQMGNFSAELEATEERLDNPLNDKPRLAARPDFRLNPVPKLNLSSLPETAALPRGMPLIYTSGVTSTFGYRANPFTNSGYEFHNGLDLAASTGTEVYSTAPGVVSQMGWNPIFGLMVLMDHGNGYQTLYGHLSATYVTQGQQVGQGGLLGLVGSTGRSTGPHLHYTVYRYGSAVDPSPYVGLQ